MYKPKASIKLTLAHLDPVDIYRAVCEIMEIHYPARQTVSAGCDGTRYGSSVGPIQTYCRCGEQWPCFTVYVLCSAGLVEHTVGGTLGHG